jgi:hypothetical protein
MRNAPPGGGGASSSVQECRVELIKLVTSPGSQTCARKAQAEAEAHAFVIAFRNTVNNSRMGFGARGKVRNGSFGAGRNPPRI